MLLELSRVDFSDTPVQIERQLGFLLHNRIAQLRDSALPFIVVHEPTEFEFLKTPKARPPQPDLGFVMNGNDRIIWPVEMKLLPDDSDATAYASEIRDNFITCRYAPFTGEGAMFGCLLKGTPAAAFVTISQEVPCKLTAGAFNPPREHMVSRHARTVPSGRHYAPEVCCHHLLVVIPLRASGRTSTTSRNAEPQ